MFVYKIRIDNFKVTATNTETVSNIAQPGVGTETIILKDVKPSGTSGGTPPSNNEWHARDLNNIENDQTWSFLSGNSIRLSPGEYKVRFEVPSFNAIRHKARLMRVGTPNTVEIVGSSNISSSQAMTHSIIEGFVTVTSNTFFFIEHHNFNNTGNQFGLSSNITGTDEVYTVGSITRIGDV